MISLRAEKKASGGGGRRPRPQAGCRLHHVSNL